MQKANSQDTHPHLSRIEPLGRHVAVALGFLLVMAAGRVVLFKELADVFEPETYGLVQIFLQVAMLAPMLFGLQLNAGLRYFAAEARSGRGRVDVGRATGVTLSLSWWLFVAMGVSLMLLAGPLGRLYDRPDAVPGLRMLAPFLIVHPLWAVLQSLLNAEKRFVISSAQLVSRQLVPLVGAIVGGTVGGGQAKWAALGYGVGLVIIVMVWAVPMRRRLRVSLRVAGEGALIRDLLRYSIPVYIGELIKSGLRPVLVLVIGLISLKEAGFVPIAFEVVSPAFMIAFALRIVAIPLIAEHATGRDRQVMADALVRWHNLMLLPLIVVLAMVGPWFIRWYYQPEFHEAAKYITPLLVLLMGNSLVRIASHVLMGLGHPEAYPRMVAIVVLVAMPGMFWSWWRGFGSDVVVWWAVAGWLAGGGVALWALVHHGAGIRWRQTFGYPIAMVGVLAVVIGVAHPFGGVATAVALGAGLLWYVAMAWRLARPTARG